MATIKLRRLIMKMNLLLLVAVSLMCSSCESIGKKEGPQLGGNLVSITTTEDKNQIYVFKKVIRAKRNQSR